MPCSEKRAWKLLEAGRARVHKLQPFTIRIVDRKVEDSVLQPLTLKIDPGSKKTGIAIVGVNDAGTTNVVASIEVEHRGSIIRDNLRSRAAFRRRRRGNLRFRAPRFDNRRRPEGWVAPSLRHRVDSTTSCIERLRRSIPVGALAMELVRFDMQLIEDPSISGTGYQQGTLAGYEIREYLLEKWGRRCAYCGCEGVPLQIEHIEPRSRGGSSRISNLTLACGPCNVAKGSMDVREFVRDPAKLARILAQAKRPLADAAAVNATRWALKGALEATGLPVATSTGGRTKWNRTRFGLPKTHALDAACVGEVEDIAGWDKPVLAIKVMGRGAYKRTRLDKHGFPRGYLPRTKDVRGFRTGDLVKAVVPSGRNAGTWTGRGPLERIVQRPDRRHDDPGHLAPALPPAAKSRRASLCDAGEAIRLDGGTAFLSGLKAGVSSGGI